MKIKYLSSILILSFLVLTPTIMAQGEIFSVLFTIFKNNTIILQKLTLEEGLTSHFPTTDTGYYVEILSDKNEKLFRANLGISFVIHVIMFPGETPNMTTELNETLINLRLPYFENAKRIVFYHLSKKILDIDLSDYFCNKNNVCEIKEGENKILCPSDCTGITTEITSTTIRSCNKNKKCEFRLGENYKTCSQDCSSGSKDGYCDKVSDSICDSDCTQNEDPDCGKPNVLWIYIIIVTVAIILLILLLIKNYKANR